jgi:uncharacterized peroxidase-related enzyme
MISITIQAKGNALMSNFTIHTIQSAPESAKPLLEQLQERVGFVPNLAATMAENPLVLETYGALSAAFARGSLTPLEREMVLMATSYANQCSYCMAAHSTFAKGHGAPDSLINTVRAGKLPDDPHLAALVGITERIARQHGEVTKDDICAFLEAGFTQAQLLELVIGISQSTFASLIHRTAHTPLDAGFEPQAWPI